MKTPPIRPFALAATLALALLLGSCGAADRAPEAGSRLPRGGGAEAAAPATDRPELPALGLSPEEEAWLGARRAGGKALRAAIRIRPDSYEVQPDGSAKGFDYELLKAFAEALDLPLELSVQTSIEAFFTREGTMPPGLGAGVAYDFTPDLLKTVDLYVGPFAIVAWRKSLMDMVPIFPTRNQLAGRKGEEISTVKNLRGKRFAVLKDSVQHKTLIELSEREGLELGFLFGNTEAALFDLVEEGKADYILDGSVYFAKNSARLGGFGISPFPEEVQSTGWSVKKGDSTLASILAKFLAASQASGLFGRLWSASYGMDFEAYLKAILWTSEAAKG